MSMVHVLAFITTKPGMRDEILAIFNANVPAVHAEEGCIEYGATIDAENVGDLQTRCGPDTFVVVEKWQSLDHLNAHAATDHMQAFGAKVRPNLVGRVVHVMSAA